MHRIKGRGVQGSEARGVRFCFAEKGGLFVTGQALSGGAPPQSYKLDTGALWDGIRGRRSGAFCTQPHQTRAERAHQARASALTHTWGQQRTTRSDVLGNLTGTVSGKSICARIYTPAFASVPRRSLRTRADILALKDILPLRNRKVVI